MLDLYIEKKPIEKKKVNKIMLRSDMPFYILTPNYDRDKKRRYVITGITEEEEAIIDNQQTLCLERGITL